MARDWASLMADIRMPAGRANLRRSPELTLVKRGARLVAERCGKIILSAFSGNYTQVCMTLAFGAAVSNDQ